MNARVAGEECGSRITLDEDMSEGSCCEVRSIARIQEAEPVRLWQSEEGRHDQARSCSALEANRSPEEDC